MSTYQCNFEGCIINCNVFGDTSLIVSVKNDNDFESTSFSLFQNYPNPFDPTTKIKITISDFGFTTLKVYDILGRETATLIDEEMRPGTYEVEFSASQLSSGIYFYKLQTENFSLNKENDTFEIKGVWEVFMKTINNSFDFLSIKKTFLLFIFSFLFFNTSLSQKLESFGLEGVRVNDIKVYNGFLFAASDSGVYRRYLFHGDSSWIHIGLEGKKITAVYPHDVGPVSWTVTVGVEPSFTPGDSALIYCLCDGWTIADSGINRSEIPSINSLDGFPSPVICGETFAAGNGKLFRREINSWYEEVFSIGISPVNVVKTNLMTGDVWIGGETGIFAPYISRSTDMGETWMTSYPDLQGDNACNSILFDPVDTNVVYAGMEGVVIKTSDGGTTWTPTALTNTPYYFYGLAYDSFNNILYAGGSTNTNELGFYSSTDKGDNWENLVFNDPSYKGISSMDIVPTNIPEIYNLYIGTFGDGVLLFQGSSVDVDIEDHVIKYFSLEQNYPNPFNPTTKIKFTISDFGFTTLKVYDILGREVATLVNEEKVPGTYEVEFNASNLSSGIYFYKLQSGTYSSLKKMIYLK